MNQTLVSGYVIGNSHDKFEHFLLYWEKCDNLVRIDTNVEEVNAGRWLRLIVKHPNFNGEFVLDYENCSGYENFNVNPHPFYAYGRFFPLKYNFIFGEVLMALRAKISVNHDLGTYELECFEINKKHIYDPDKLLEIGGIWNGKEIIIEIQAVKNGWRILRVHEDPRKSLSCDNLANSFVPYTAFFLDETDLPSVLTFYQSAFREDSVNIPLSTETNPTTAASTIILKEITENEIDKIKKCIGSMENALNEPSCSTIKNERKSNKKDDRFFLINDTSLKYTSGTKGLSEREYDFKISNEQENLWLNQGVIEHSVIKVLCLVVDKFSNFAVLFTTKSNVANVLLNQNTCKELTKEVNVGDIAYFDICQRRLETVDCLFDHIPYTHVAVKKYENNVQSEKKIESFKNRIRTFGNLLEIKVEIDLSIPRNITKYYNSDASTKKSEEERKLYFLKTTKGFLVSIPCGRLMPHLGENLLANIKLQAWAVRKKSVENVCLHIGPTCEVLCIYESGKKTFLPPLTEGYLMNAPHNTV